MKYHCLIGVTVKSARSEDPGKLYLKYFLKYDESDVEAVKKAIEMSENKIWKTPVKEALQICNKSQLIDTVHSLILSSNANDATIHHFTSDYEIEEKYIENIVKLANHVTYYRNLLNESKILKKERSQK